MSLEKYPFGSIVMVKREGEEERTVGMVVEHLTSETYNDPRVTPHYLVDFPDDSFESFYPEEIVDGRMRDWSRERDDYFKDKQ